MMINRKRLGSLLIPHGFIEAYYNEAVFDLVFVRRHSKHLFELIQIHASGRDGEAVPAEAVINVTPGYTLYYRMSIHEIVMDVAADKERCWTVINNDEDAIAWEKSVAEIVPAKCASLVQRRGQELLDRTASSRLSAERYHELIQSNLSGNVSDTLLQLRKIAPPEMIEHASRAIRIGGLMGIPNGWNYYELASLAIQYYAETVEGDSQRFAVCTSPFDDREWLWRLQILASRIAQEPGWSLPYVDRTLFHDSSSTAT